MISTSTTQKSKPEVKSEGEIESMQKEIESLIHKNHQQEEQITKLTNFLLALKNKSTEIKFFNFDEYEKVSMNGECAISSVKLVIKKENQKFTKKELKDFNRKNMQRFIIECKFCSYFIIRAF